MFDRTTNDCKLFKGSLTDLHNDCREVGYAVHPKYTECDKVFDVSSAQACFVSKNGVFVVYMCAF